MRNGKIEERGNICYFKDDELHREDGPALIKPDGFSAWFIAGKLHREDLPAIETTEGYKAWFVNGIRHRSDAPAIMDNGNNSYYYFGYFAPNTEVFFNQRWRDEIEAMIAGIKDAPDEGTWKQFFD